MSKSNRKILFCIILFILGYSLSVWNDCLASPTISNLQIKLSSLENPTPKSQSAKPQSQPIYPIHVESNQILLRGSELCPQSLMAINTQLSPSGDILVWCAEPPSQKVVLH